MTNRERAFLTRVSDLAGEFEDSNFRKVFSISHNDADGIGCSQIIHLLLTKRNQPNSQILFNRRGSWKNFLAPILNESESLEGKTAFVFSDLGDVDVLVPIFENRGEEVYILDHHEISHEIDLDSLPENIHLANPTVFGLDGLKEVAGATVNYLFAKQIDRKIVDHSWLGVLGIAGDSLMPIDQLRSLNKELYDEAKMEESVEEKSGLALLGASHETVKNALRLSILPFIAEFGGIGSKVTPFLKSLSIPPNKKAEFLSSDEVDAIQGALREDVRGCIATFPGRQGILKFAFEYAVTLNILGFHSKSAALRLLGRRGITQQAKSYYYNYIENLVANLSKFVNLPSERLGERGLLLNLTNSIPKDSWSDTASFASVNNLYDPEKILFVYGKENSKLKFSIRCNEQFLNTNSFGVDEVIRRVVEKVGGQGGGHKLAGGFKIDLKDFPKFRREVPNLL
ncbi:MAG: DHHA1 domain-containing protein [Promethearchaeota archaeon]